MSEDELIKTINELKNSPINKVVNNRITEFLSIRRDFNTLFRELAFCILTAGTSAELGVKTIAHLGDTLLNGDLNSIQEKLKEVYRFHTVRAGYLFNARDKFKQLNINSPNIRDELVEKIKGLGMKEASHFLRNVGFEDYAIIDFHIIDILEKYGLIEKPKTMTKNKYLEIEDILKKLAKKVNLSLAELDLYLWYKETGKVLK